jgi:hypothetical protein
MYSVASPKGDLSITGEKLQVLLEGCDSGITYGGYFSAIRCMLSADNFQAIQSLARLMGHLALPQRIHVRAEKHGALYHPASLELIWPNETKVKCAILVAVSARGRVALRREALVLDHLQEAYCLPLLPKKLLFVENETAAFLIEPWFSDFHEFHLTSDGCFQLWDYGRGLRLLSASQAQEAFFQAARILTLFVDSKSGACIHPWSHAAGDFILCSDPRGEDHGKDHDVDVRLTTARGYGPLLETENPLSALFIFVLDLALRMRLDRVDGVGQWVWLGPDILENAVRGFFAAVSEREGSKELQTVAHLLPSFSAQELAQSSKALLERFSPGERDVVALRLEQHCGELFEILQRFARTQQQ